MKRTTKKNTLNSELNKIKNLMEMIETDDFSCTNKNNYEIPETEWEGSRREQPAIDPIELEKLTDLNDEDAIDDLGALSKLN